MAPLFVRAPLVGFHCSPKAVLPLAILASRVAHLPTTFLANLLNLDAWRGVQLAQLSSR